MRSVKRNILLAGVTAGMLYTLFQLTRPTEIVAVHTREYGPKEYSHQILVKHFPITERGQLAWWQNHQAMLKEKYGIPKTKVNGGFNITIWDFGDGYQIEKPEASFFPSRDTSYLLCFDDMPVKENCIEKKPLMTIDKNGRSNVTYFDVGSLFSAGWSRYIQTPGDDQIRAIANDKD